MLPLPVLGQPRPARGVVATVAMVGDMVRDVSGGAVRVDTLVGEGVDPHLFRPTRADIARLLGADAVFGNGHRLEGRMGDVLDRVRAAGKPVVLVAESLPRERLRANPDYPDAADPHVWMDPTLWAEAAGSVEGPLGRLLPDVRERLNDNLGRFRDRLARLDAYAREAIASIPATPACSSPRMTPSATSGALRARDREHPGLSTEAEANLAAIEALVRKLVERRVPRLRRELGPRPRRPRADRGRGRAGQRVALGGNLFSTRWAGPAPTRAPMRA
jgi:manganese/zinc/iron transport system substrate-binding protein